MNEDIDDTAKETGGGLTVSEALEMYENYKDYWSENYREAAIDLKMSVGDKATHWGQGWDDSYAAPPKGTPCIVINELPQFIHQVCNDERQNTPSIKTLPDTDGDIETASVFSDLIRGIEYKSSADEAYDNGGESAVTCSLGFIRVDHDYCYDDSDEQELLIKKVADPLSNFIDPASVECDGRDSMGAVSLEAIDKKTFERLYPNKKFTSFVDPKNPDNKESIVIGEIFIKEISGKRGKKVTIHRYKFSGEEELARTTFPGEYIPLVPVYGTDVWIEGKRFLGSLIRQARDPQRRLNHWAGKESQILSMAPIAPVMAPVGVLVNDRGQWQKPGTEMVLEYNTMDIDGNPASPPTRLQPPPVPTGIINAMQGAKENIKESMGLYNASIGQRSNETSGVAIDARKSEGDVATFHFADNLRRSITHVGRILVAAIPEIYDTARIVQTMTEENEPKMVGINGAMADEQEKPVDLRKGKYQVRVTTGASYTTKRQEAASFLSDMFKQAPELLQIGGDILFQNLDLPGAQALANRFKKTIDPKLLDDNKQDPQVQQMGAVIQQMQQQLQQMAAALERKKNEEALKQGELQIKKGELMLKNKELEIKQAELLQKQQQGGDKINTLDIQKQTFDQQITLRQQDLAEAEFQLEVTEALQAKLVSEQQLQNMQPLAQETAGASSNQEITQ